MTVASTLPRCVGIVAAALLAACGSGKVIPEDTPCYAAERSGWTEVGALGLPQSLWQQVEFEGFTNRPVSYYADDSGNYYVCHQMPFCSSEIWIYRPAGGQWDREDPPPVQCD